MGQQIWEYTHQCDHSELREALIKRNQNKNEKITRRNVLIRIKCTLTSRGRSVNIKSASYKVSSIEIWTLFIEKWPPPLLLCRFQLQVISIVGNTVYDEKKNNQLFVGIARPIPHPSNIEVPLDSKTFLTKHSLDMKFSYVDDKYVDLRRNRFYISVLLINFKTNFRFSNSIFCLFSIQNASDSRLQTIRFNGQIALRLSSWRRFGELNGSLQERWVLEVFINAKSKINESRDAARHNIFHITLDVYDN